jgi:hypothetical protein
MAEPPILIFKDPDSIRVYGRDWTGFLEGDTIALSNWFATPDDSEEEGGLILSGSTHSDTATAIRVAGGIEGKEYRVTNRIVTSDSEETEDASFDFIMEHH